MSLISRRTFLWITGGTGVAIATAAERKVVNRLIPQVIPPEQIQPGEWSFFATTCRECPAGCGMQLWHRDGRVTKAEGNPQHPVNRGTLCARGQSALQGLYDPDRLQSVLYRPKSGAEQKVTWERALDALGTRLAAGGRVAVLSGLQTGALAEVMRAFAAAFGGGRALFYERFNYEPLRRAHRELFGVPVIPSYDLSRSDFIISFAADFLETWISPVEYAGQFADMHALRAEAPLGQPKMGRFVYVGPRLSMTAANADEFIQVPPGAVRLVAGAILDAAIGLGTKQDLSAVRGALKDYLSRGGAIPGVSPQKITELARAFTSAGASVALAGAVGTMSLDAVEAAGAAALLNYGAGRIGQTVDFSRPHALSGTATDAEIRELVNTFGPSDILFVHDCNPVYSRPELQQLLRRAGTVVYLGTMMDETAQTAHWVLPTDYPLESWGEYQPYPDVNGIMQPTMGRLYDTRGAGDLLLELARRGGRPLTGSGGTAPRDFLGWLRHRWEAMPGASAGTSEGFWTTALRGGGSWSKSGAGQGVTLGPRAAGLFAAGATPQRTEGRSAQLWLWSSVFHFDGRYANRGWLQEAPDPLSSIVWGNWVDLHPAKAKAIGIADGEVAELATPAGAVRAPVRVTEEVNEETAAIAFGFGHQGLGKIARGIGANTFVLPGAPATGGGFGTCRIRKVDFEELPAYTMRSQEQFHREVLKWAPLTEVSRMAPGEGEKLVLPLPEGYRKEKDLYPKREYKVHRWAMVIDLHRCIGCGACSVACYAENNISVIGGPRISHGREMSWIRVAAYRKPGARMRYGFLPLPCQHCDAAPCEPVCPVFAAVHNEEGLNAQIYNRCIGTRYCSNNCPYKVRRFNWVNINWEKPLELQLNPEVTVRSRGVMEKCTFCVQRIRQVEFRAAVERRKIRDGEIEPACAQTCPARVFTFGDLLDPDSRVSRLTRMDPRRYHLLEDLNTKPGVTYLKRIDSAE